MNMKTWIPLGLAVVLGVVAMVVAKDMLGKKNEQKQAVGNLTSIVVTKGSMAPGQELKAEDLAMGEVATTSLPEGAFTDIKQAVGRTTQVSLSKGQPILQTVLAADGAGNGWQALVPPDMRAITIEVNEFSGLAGMITPSSDVDVVTTIQGEDNTGMSSRTIVQNVKVLAVGQRVSADQKPQTNPNNGQPEPFRNVTLLVKPEEAEAIQLATQTGRPWLLLRNGKDDKVEKSTGVSVADLRGKNNKLNKDRDPFGTPISDLMTRPVGSPTTQPTEPGRRVKIIRGGQESEVTLPEPTKPSTDPGVVTSTKEGAQ
jgi:pilus assembly protein CpaB